MKKLKFFLTGLFLAFSCAAAFGQASGGGYNYLNITGTTTNVIKSVPGFLHSVCLNKPLATAVITIYDGVSSSGTVIGTITVPASPQANCFIYDVQFGTGLTVIQGTASSDITVSYR